MQLIYGRALAPGMWLKTRRMLLARCAYCTRPEEQKISLTDGTQINYVLVGEGRCPVLCFPGALGTIWSDFAPQLTRLDRRQFTVVAFDPPGYGNSRPPNRQFHVDFYEDDADTAHALMLRLGFKRFSLLGWSDGGNSSIILAARYPEAVHKLVVWGANSYLLPEDVDALEAVRDTSQWSEKARAPLERLYGADRLQAMWAAWCDVQQALQRLRGGDVCMQAVSRVACPTLVLHGAKDPLVRAEHPNYLNANIRDCRLHVFPQGKHNVHLRYADQFNAIVTEFLLADSDNK